MTNDARAAAKNRYVLAIIIGSIVLVVFLSILLFSAAVNGRIDLPALLGTKNNGVLIRPPLAVADLPLTDNEGEPFVFAKQPKRWSIVIPVASHCDQQCQHVLYMTRQIHIALGKYADRVARYLIATEYPLDADFEDLLKQHPKLKILRTDSAVFAQHFARAGLQPLQSNQYLVLDPDGWFMMYYGPQHDGKAVLSDLKFLLTNSRENEGSN